MKTNEAAGNPAAFAIFRNYFLKAIDILILVCYNNIIKERKEVEKMDNIEKALQELAKAVESNDTVERVKVTITLVKPKPNKAKPDNK